MSRLRFGGKVVIVTGAGGGIGKKVAFDFISEGATVVATDVQTKGLDELVDTATALPGRLQTYVGDLTVQGEAEKILDASRENYGKIDVLVNCAGIGGHYEPVGELTNELWEKVLAVNLSATMYTMRRAVQIMLTQETRGNIVNIASVCGIEGALSGIAYTVSKHGVIALTKNTAYNYMHEGIRCNAIAPGMIDTGMIEDSPLDSEFGKKRFLDGFGVGRYKQGLPKDVSELVRFVASEEAAFINGSVLLTDGGLLSY